jgi:hypothetical protein
MGCPVVQGYFLARPMNASDFGVMLRDRFDYDSGIDVALVTPEEVSPLG